MLDNSKHDGYTHYSSLENKVVFITGGATGIGAALVEAFVTQKSKVAFVDIDHEAAEILCNTLAKKGWVTPHFIACDIRNIEHLQSAILQTQKELGDIAILINNAANDQRYVTADISQQEWMDSLAINLHPAFFAAQAVLPKMKQQYHGVILNISSINVKFSPADLTSYITAKAGLIGMAKALATEAGEYHIRVNTVLPGWVATTKQLEKWLTQEEEKKLIDRMCIKKRLTTHDVAKLVLFLASDDASMITAQEFVVDGGRM